MLARSMTTSATLDTRARVAGGPCIRDLSVDLESASITASHTAPLGDRTR